ncbi:unnamed protein product [Rotaria magnacalcarata]|uniref:Protein kinase domain-containing protein n=1 Tax=Rotaria magnacalcarata TaxID=392030 RepID=A0A8S2N6L1_9BILA|nr:unnamed protein product [Rotaria magnacalcarata]
MTYQNRPPEQAPLEFPYIGDVSQYERIDKIGQGTFGEVFKARCKKTNDFVAMKLILMDQEKEGFPITALREIKILQELRHDNIVRLIEVCRSASERDYGPAIDMWGVGCIFAEMWIRSPIMQGTSEQHQLELISHLCGSIEPGVWPGVNKLPLYTKLKLPQSERRKVHDRMKPYIQEPLALDLIDKLLTLDPKQRIDADNAVSSDFFYSEPPLADLKPLLSKYPSMFELKEVSRNAYNPQMQQQQQQQQRMKQARPNVPNLPSEPIY